MDIKTKNEKIRFFRNWTLLNTAFFVISYILIIIFSILMMEALQLPKDEWGSPFQQTIWKIGEGILIGLSIGLIQWRLLRKIISIPSFWIFSIPTGILLTELIAGIILWKMGINRGEFNFWENNPLPHALITAIYGLVIGLIQVQLLKNHFTKSTIWIAASTLAWGVSILIISIKVTNDLFLFVTFILGLLLFGAITGATLMWILKPKEINS